MDGIRVMIGGRDIPLRFKMPEFMAIEEEIGNLGDIRELLLKGKKRGRNMIGVIRIMGNAGLKAEGKEADLTDEWLTENMDPHAMIAYQATVIAALSKEEASEAVKEENENKERDLVMEEIDAKKDPVNLHTGG